MAPSPDLPGSWAPRFKSNLQVLELGWDGHCVVSETDTFLLEGRAMTAVVPLIDGRRSFIQVMEAASAAVSHGDARVALGMLHDAGYLEDALSAGPPAVNALCHELRTTYSDASKLLAERPIEFVNLSAVTHQELLEFMQRSGIRVATDDSVFTLVVCDDYRDVRLVDLNARCLAQGRPWMIAKPTGFNTWLGPVFRPPGGACWSCLDHRLTHNRQLFRLAERRLGRRQPVLLNLRSPDSSRFQAYGGLLEQLCRVLIERPNPRLGSHLAITDTLNHGTTWHPVVKRPECAACGPRVLSPVRRYEPEAASLASPLWGGLRREAPEVTFQRFQHQISPVTGIVTSIDPSPYNASTPLRVYTAGHNFALTTDTPRAVRDSVRALSSGKGRTDAEARTSALCEALERFSGLFQGTETRRRATYRDLGASALDPRTCLLFSDRQYADRDQWLARGGRFQVVPRAFDPAAAIEWSPVIRYGTEEIRYLPTAQLYYGYPYEEKEFFCWADSNGCASGTSFDDACLQGLLELVERDAVALWWYNRYQVPALLPHEMRDDYYVVLADYFKTIGREFWALDLSHDLGVPVFCAVTRRVDSAVEDIVMGFGAHLDPRIALNRAVTEMNQFLPAVMRRHPDGTTAYDFEDRDALHWWRTARIEDQVYLQGRTRRASDDLGPGLSARGCSGAPQVAALVERVRSAGCDVFVLDQTRPEVGLPVARMIAPGLRHFWARFADGRLYDVPVRLGFLERRNEESDLNPIAMFL